MRKATPRVITVNTVIKVLTVVALGLPTATPALPTSTATAEESSEPSTAQIELGSRLFRELNFTNQAADYGASCAGCHATGSKVRDRSERRFADYSPRSMNALKVVTQRNTPTLLDIGRMERLGWAGEWDSLAALVEDKLTGEQLGWGPADRQRAQAAIHFTLLEEGSGGATSGSYAEQFRTAYGVDVEKLSDREVVVLGARAIADYVTSLTSTRTAPWDAFVAQNRFHPGPNRGESAENYSFGLFSRIGNQEGRQLIKRPVGFSRDAYRGFKTFFRTTSASGEPVGNCVACHTPPDFTDFGFHNTGIAEAEYDKVHGAGAASRMARPKGPSPATRAIPVTGDPTKIDLGYWNQAPQVAGSYAAFKTPTLRNLGGTDPYMHNGAYPTLEDALSEIVRIAGLAAEGKLPDIDPEVRKIRLGKDDVGQLAAFLRQLDEVGHEGFRRYLIELADD